jgi:hypothetical protein
MPPLRVGFGTGAVFPRAGTALCGCARRVDVPVRDCPNFCGHRGEAVVDKDGTVPDDVPVSKRHGGTCGQAGRPACSLIRMKPLPTRRRLSGTIDVSGGTGSLPARVSHWLTSSQCHPTRHVACARLQASRGNGLRISWPSRLEPQPAARLPERNRSLRQRTGTPLPRQHLRKSFPARVRCFRPRCACCWPCAHHHS